MGSIEAAIAILKKRGVIVYPTETLFALGGMALDGDVCQRIVEIKRRPPSKPFPIIVGNYGQLHLLVQRVPPVAERIIRLFWPAPLSILLPARSGLPPEVVGEEDMVCVRCSPHPVARSLCLETGFPLIATSANISGEPPPSSPDQVSPEVLSQIDTIISPPPPPQGGAPSTIISITPEEDVKVIRKGAFPSSLLLKAGVLPCSKN